MELINQTKRTYGPPATLNAHEPEWDIRAVYESPFSERDRLYHVRGQNLNRTGVTKQEKGHTFRWCYFGDHPQWVNDENIRFVRLSQRK